MDLKSGVIVTSMKKMTIFNHRADIRPVTDCCSMFSALGRKKMAGRDLPFVLITFVLCAAWAKCWKCLGAYLIDLFIVNKTTEAKSAQHFNYEVHFIHLNLQKGWPWQTDTFYVQLWWENIYIPGYVVTFILFFNHQGFLFLVLYCRCWNWG